MNSSFLKNILNKFSWQEIYDEIHGIVEKEESFEKYEKVVVPKKSRRQAVEVNGKRYKSIIEASKDLNISYSTLADYASRRRTPKINIKKIDE